MPDKAISNTSPLLYLHRCGGLAWLPRLFTLVCVPGAVAFELAEARRMTPWQEERPSQRD